MGSHGRYTEPVHQQMGYCDMPRAIGQSHSLARLAVGGMNVLPAHQLPMLTTVNESLRRGVQHKPGVSVLWRGKTKTGGAQVPLLIETPYGRGYEAWRAGDVAWQVDRSLTQADIRTVAAAEVRAVLLRLQA